MFNLDALKIGSSFLLKVVVRFQWKTKYAVLT